MALIKNYYHEEINTMIKENEFDFREYTDRGNIAEKEFCKAVKKISPKTVIVKATKEQDMNEHWDYSFDGVKIDIKARRNIGVLNSKGDKYTVLEFINRQGKKGSLYGDADYIAFEYITDLLNCFVVVPRLELVRYAEDNIKDEWVTDQNEMVNKKYQGFNTKFVITAVSLEEISMLPNTKIVYK